MFPDQMEFRSVQTRCFCGGRKTKEPRETSLEEGKNQQQTQPTSDD